VLASEIDEAARSTYAANFGSSELVGDISGLYAGQGLPSFDVLTGGFPCQSFSCRGEQRGMEDPRGLLFSELVRLLRCCQPKAFLFENVAALVTIDGGRRNKRTEPLSATEVGTTFRHIMDAFQAEGYVVEWKILNSRHWLPQMRERVYVVGFRADQGVSTIDWTPPGGIGIDTTVRMILEASDSEEVARSALTAEQWATIQSEEFVAKAGRWKSKEGVNDREIGLDSKAPTLVSSYHNASSYSTKYIFEEADGTTREVPRFLTPRECARVMGFQDSFSIPLGSDHLRGRFYHQIGNAVCPPVIAAIGDKMLSALGL